MNSTITNIPCSYYVWSDFSIFFTSISMFLSISFGLLTLWYQRWQIKNKQIFYCFTFISSLLLLIESIDPLSLLGIISPLAIGILSNISTWFSLVLFCYFLISLIQIIEYGDLINWRLTYVYIAIAVSFIFTLTASILQVKYPIWQGIKLIVFAISLIFFTIGADYYFYRIIKLFDRLNNENYQSNLVDKQWYLIGFLIIYHILILFIVTIQIFWGINLINNQNIQTVVTWENILLFSLHIIVLIVSEIFFLGKFKIEFN